MVTLHPARSAEHGKQRRTPNYFLLHPQISTSNRRPMDASIISCIVSESFKLKVAVLWKTLTRSLVVTDDVSEALTLSRR